MVSKVVDRAVGALAVVTGLARHVIWYVSYQIDGNARADEREPRDSASR